MNEQKPKNYYSLNLTEGRIFLIFITVLIVITVIIFSIALLISKSNSYKNSNADISTDGGKLKIIENENPVTDNYTYYNLNNEQNEDSFLAQKEETSDEENKTQDTESITQNNSKTDSSQKDIQVQVKENEDQEDIVRLDNDNVLYSSKYSNKNETTTVQSKPKITTKQEPVIVKENTAVKKREVRYTVQVGSYLDKKTAEEISLFYKIQGYPAYITEKMSGDKRFYRLRVGPFKVKEDAEKYLTSLKGSKYGKESSIWVVYL